MLKDNLIKDIKKRHGLDIQFYDKFVRIYTEDKSMIRFKVDKTGDVDIEYRSNGKQYKGGK